MIPGAKRAEWQKKKVQSARYVNSAILFGAN
jgi:hypothetical protein